MILEIQIKLIIFSFLFGAFLSFMIDINKKYLYSNNKIFKAFFTFIFILVHTLLYFLILQKINNGIIHIYSFLTMTLGFYLEHVLLKKIIKKFISIFKKQN